LSGGFGEVGMALRKAQQVVEDAIASIAMLSASAAPN
jgi:hypothetical protein